MALALVDLHGTSAVAQGGGMTGKAASTTRPPRVTIGMPVYNGARHVAKSIESLLVQTFTDFEIIIADNCSSDATARYLP